MPDEFTAAFRDAEALAKMRGKEAEAPILDPWQHRSQKMKCRTCMWFALKLSAVPVEVGAPMLGRCRKHAPTLSGYPVVFDHDWCGDHKLDENAPP